MKCKAVRNRNVFICRTTEECKKASVCKRMITQECQSALSDVSTVQKYMLLCYIGSKAERKEKANNFFPRINAFEAGDMYGLPTDLADSTQLSVPQF